MARFKNVYYSFKSLINGKQNGKLIESRAMLITRLITTRLEHLLMR